MVPVSVSVGDSVLLPEYGGTKIEMNEQEYLIFRDTDILGKFEDWVSFSDKIWIFLIDHEAMKELEHMVVKHWDVMILICMPVIHARR